MKKSDVSVSCYSGSIKQILNYYLIDMRELDLFFSKYLLVLNCYSPYEGLYTDLELIVNDALEHYGISIKNIAVNNIFGLKNKIKEYGRLLLKIDCKFLTYSKIFSESNTSQGKHYVVVKNSESYALDIIDSYIPSSKISTYEGWLQISEDILDNLEFKYVDISDIKNTIEINALNVTNKMLQNYFCNADLVFDQFLLNMKKSFDFNQGGEKAKKIVFEMYTSLSVSGLIASRKIFYSIIKESAFFKEELLLKMGKIVTKYDTLRLLLLKYFINYNRENLDTAIKKTKEIKTFERKLYLQMESCLKVI